MGQKSRPGSCPGPSPPLLLLAGALLAEHALPVQNEKFISILIIINHNKYILWLFDIYIF